jgi:hypothetical protein
LNATIFGGPKFQVESDRLVIGLGNSERRKVGALLARTFDETGLFPREIVVQTINEIEKSRGSKKQRDLFKDSTLAMHSAASMYVDEGLQIIAFNAPEPLPALTLIKRGVVDAGKEKIDKEPGSHKTGLGDMALALLQMGISPITTTRTMRRIWNGYSATADLAAAGERFPAGRALVHSELDAFQFVGLADMETAARSGVSTAVIPNHWHNEILFAPNRTLLAVMPHILPHIELVSE